MGHHAKKGERQEYAKTDTAFQNAQTLKSLVVNWHVFLILGATQTEENVLMASGILAKTIREILLVAKQL